MSGRETAKTSRSAYFPPPLQLRLTRLCLAGLGRWYISLPHRLPVSSHAGLGKSRRQTCGHLQSAQHRCEVCIRHGESKPSLCCRYSFRSDRSTADISHVVRRHMQHSVAYVPCTCTWMDEYQVSYRALCLQMSAMQDIINGSATTIWLSAQPQLIASH